jgi:hypothetical protein
VNSTYLGLDLDDLPAAFAASSRACGLSARRRSSATDSMPPVPHGAQGLDDARLGEDIVGVVNEKEVDHQPDDLSGVKCSPAVSLDNSENLRINYS